MTTMCWRGAMAGMLFAFLAWIPDAGAKASAGLQPKRVESLYCTLLLAPGLDAADVNRRISTRGVPLDTVKPSPTDIPEKELAGKADVLFRRVQEVLEMRPPEARVTIRVEKDTRGVQAAHHARYGTGTPAIAFYTFEDNTIYVAAGSLCEEVLAHEMAHCVVDHFFGMRAPSKVEEMLAVYAADRIRQ